MDDIYLATFRSMDVKRISHVAAVAKGLPTFAVGLTVDEEVDVDLWV